jgi:hypothetical protein
MAPLGSPMRAVIFALLCAGALCAAPKLKIDRLALHQFEDGELLDPGYQFLPGETAFFSCRLANFEVDESDAQHRKVKLAWTVEVRDPSGVLLVEPAQGRIDTELLKEDTDWLPKFLKNFVVPGFAFSGDYKISVRVHDEVSDDDVAGDLKFHVKGRAVQPSPTLAVRNFMFLTSEDDTLGMRQPVYHPGGMAWARMDVTGYKFGDHNRFSVAFGMELQGPDGKPVFTQPEAGTESSQSFYAQSYVPGGLTLSLDKDAPPGIYTLVVTVRDQIGDQSVELVQPFRVQ